MSVPREIRLTIRFALEDAKRKIENSTRILSETDREKEIDRLTAAMQWLYEQEDEPMPQPPLPVLSQGDER